MTPAKRARKSQTPAISTTGPNAEIDALVRRCLRGDQVAWDTIVRTYRRKVFNVAYKFVAKHDEAEDLTQEIFIKVFKSLKTFDRRANFQTWLVSISRNLCIDHYRAVRKERQTIDRNVDAGVLRPIAPELSPIFRIEQRDRVELLREALKGLQPMLRSAIIMRDLQEMSYSQIAAQLDLPEGTVKSRINRGRIELAQQIKRMRGEQYRPSEESTPSDTARLPGASK